MIKYVPEDTSIVFEEIPGEVTLAINISNCPHHCPGCHSPYLREDVGEELNGETLVNLIVSNRWITCVLFMGEGKDEERLFYLIELIRRLWGRSLKIGLYTGSEHVSEFLWENLDYIKLGPYIEEFGPLNSKNTNQHLYKHDISETHEFSSAKLDGKFRPYWTDITDMFWKRSKGGA